MADIPVPPRGELIPYQTKDGHHPLRTALDKLQTLDTVRIIEGEA